MFVLAMSCMLLVGSRLCSALDKDIYTVVVLGNTGVGKSSLLNMLAGREETFKEGDGAMSETALATAKDCRLLGDPRGLRLRLVDTQGLSDSAGTAEDTRHLKEMVAFIRRERTVDLFIVCFDGSSPRFSSYARAMVDVFSDIFPSFHINIYNVESEFRFLHIKYFREAMRIVTLPESVPIILCNILMI